MKLCTAEVQTAFGGTLFLPLNACRRSKGAHLSPWVSAASKDMKVLASKLRTTLKDWMADTEVPLARAAISELQDMVKVIRMLCQDEDPDNTALDSVMTACKGSRQSLRSAISSNSYWGPVQKKCREICLGLTTLKPEVDKALSQIADTQVLEVADKVAFRLPIWSDGLPPGPDVARFLLLVFVHKNEHSLSKRDGPTL